MIEKIRYTGINQFTTLDGVLITNAYEEIVRNLFGTVINNIQITEYVLPGGSKIEFLKEVELNFSDGKEWWPCRDHYYDTTKHPKRIAAKIIFPKKCIN